MKRNECPPVVGGVLFEAVDRIARCGIVPHWLIRMEEVMAKRVMNWTSAGSVLSVVVEGFDKPLTVDAMAIDGGYDKLSELGRLVFVNGLKQKVADSAAGLDTARDKMDAMAGTVELLLAGTWGRVKKAAARATDLANALVIVKGIDLETAMEKVLAVEKDIWSQWEKHPAVAGELASIEAKRASERMATAKKAAKDAPELEI